MDRQEAQDRQVRSEVLVHAEMDVVDVTFTKDKKDYGDGIKEYEIEF